MMRLPYITAAFLVAALYLAGPLIYTYPWDAYPFSRLPALLETPSARLAAWMITTYNDQRDAALRRNGDVSCRLIGQAAPMTEPGCGFRVAAGSTVAGADATLLGSWAAHFRISPAPGCEGGALRLTVLLHHPGRGTLPLASRDADTAGAADVVLPFSLDSLQSAFGTVGFRVEGLSGCAVLEHVRLAADGAAPPTGGGKAEPAATGAIPGPPAGTMLRDCAECPDMIIVPAGRFFMGSSPLEPGRPNEWPRHQVLVERPFAIGRYEITFAEWDACVAAGGCGGYIPKDEGWGRGRRPVINVSVRHAEAYAAWLSARTGHRYRLPSEAEWEYAARAGDTPAGAVPGHFLADRHHPAAARTLPVGSFPANAFGLHDVGGNVWEYTADWAREDYTSAGSSAQATQDGLYWARMLRGGSWMSAASDVRPAARMRLNLALYTPIAGFRLVRDLEWTAKPAD